MDMDTIHALERLLPPAVPLIPTAEDWRRFAALGVRLKRDGTALADNERDYQRAMAALRQMPAFRDEADQVISDYQRSLRAKEIAAVQKSFEAIKSALGDWKLPTEVMLELKGLATNPGDGRRIIYWEETHGKATIQGALNDLREGEKVRAELARLNEEQAKDRTEAEKKAEARQALLKQAAQERARPKATA